MEVAGIELGVWDFATFAAFFIVGAGGLALVVLILGLPGRIALARNHPDAEAVNLRGLDQRAHHSRRGPGADLGPEAD